MMYCANDTCPMDRVFDGGSHGFRCPACGQSLMMTGQQLLRGGVIFLLLGAFGALVTAAVLSGASWGEIVRLDSPITAATLTVATLACAVGLMFGTTQLLVWTQTRRREKAAAAAAMVIAAEEPEQTGD
jgi:hypothetical protein